MNRSRFSLFTVIILLSFAGRIASAQTSDITRDFLFIGIDPKTLDGGRNADIYLIRSDGSRVTNLTKTPLDSENHAYWSADGKQIYFSRNSMSIYPGSTEEQSSTSFFTMDISDTGEKVSERLLFHLSDLIGKPMRVEDWALSPDERTLVFIPNNESLGGTFLVNTDGSSLREVLPIGLVTTSMPLRWSPDSTEFAYILQDCNASITNLCPYWVMQRDGDKSPEFIGDDKELMKHWQPDATFAIYRLSYFEVLRGDKVLLHSQNTTPAISPDNSLVAYAVHNQASNMNKVVTADLGEYTIIRELTRPLKGITNDIKWSPDGKQLAIIQWPGDDYEVIVYTVNADGTGLKELLRRQIWTQYDNLAWRPDIQPKVG